MLVFNSWFLALYTLAQGRCQPREKPEAEGFYPFFTLIVFTNGSLAVGLSARL